jgi:hypothetical protein
VGVLDTSELPVPSEPTGAERRRSPRRPLHEVPGIVEVKLASEKVKVIDISRDGMLMACGVRLLPSRETRLRVIGVDQSLWVPCRIVRCQIMALSKEKVVYLAAVNFNEPIPWLEKDDVLAQTIEKFEKADESELPSVLDYEALTPAFLLNNW